MCEYSTGDIPVCSHFSSSSALPLVSGSTGLLDPCQKGRVDATSLLTVQERLDLTVSAQVNFVFLPFWRRKAGSLSAFYNWPVVFPAKIVSQTAHTSLIIFIMLSNGLVTLIS